MKKKAESNPDPVARREALASDVERFLNSGKEIEQIPNGVSSYSPQGPVKSLNPQKTGQANANTIGNTASNTATDTATSADTNADASTSGQTDPSVEQVADTAEVKDEATAK